MLVPKEVGDMLDASEPYFPRATVEALFARFCAGQFMTVTRKKGVRADLERLENVDEVWSMCFRTPRPGGRLLGRFLDRDVFVGLSIHYREDLAGRKYEARAADAVDIWNSKVAPATPVRSNQLSDYLGHTYRDLDEND